MQHPSMQRPSTQHPSPRGDAGAQGTSLRQTEEREGTGGTAHLSRTLWLRGLMGNVSAPPDIDSLARRMREVLVPKGEALYRRGGSADHICFIVNGCIKQGSEGLSEFHSGDVLGFVDALRDRPHKSDAIALSDTTVLLLAVEDWFEFLEDNFEFFREMMFSRVADLPLSTQGYEADAAALLGLSDGELDHPAEKSRGTSFVHALLALHSCPLFQKASIQTIAQLARGARGIVVEQATMDLRPQGRGLWVVAEGTVTLRAQSGDQRLETSLGPGQLVGSVTPLGSVPEELSVASADGAWLLFIDQELFFDVMEDHFDLGRSALSFMAAQVEARNRTAGQPWQRVAGLPSPRGLPDLGSSPSATEHQAG